MMRDRKTCLSSNIMTGPPSPTQVLFLDYSVLDHIHRVDAERYSGQSATALMALRQAAAVGGIEIWMSRVTSVEMVIGLETPNLSQAKLATASQNDKDKYIIASSMHIRWLTYPANRSDDNYSRVSLTLGSDGLLDWEKAKALENKLALLGVSKKGDAQQVVACVYGRSEDDGRQPVVRWLLSEDGKLRKALNRALAANALGELARIKVLSVKEFVHGRVNEQ